MGGRAAGWPSGSNSSSAHLSCRGTQLLPAAAPARRSFQLLDSYLDTAQQGDAEAQRAVPGLLQRCIDANSRFEGLVQRCIGVEA